MSPSQTVENRDQLIQFIASGCKLVSDFKVGTEHEKFVFRNSDHRALPYEGEVGIGNVLHQLQRFGWIPVMENGNIIALTHEGESITLEPGGQFELSGAPRVNVHETCAEVHRHLVQVKAVASELDIGFLGLGFQPLWRRDEIPVMPKRRYEIMRAYMPKVGNLGLDMMLRSCTVQANLDFSSETDMVRKLQVGLALQPVATALFANSPFTDGKPNGYLSYRSHIWTDTDPDRCGTLPFAFESGMGFERYVDYALDVPMYFVYRDGCYHDVSGQSFRDFLKGSLPGLPGELPTIDDWESHLTTIFPEVRIKRYIEMRGADGGSWQRICALPAFWVGLLYDKAALDGCEVLMREMSADDRERLRAEVPLMGLSTPYRGGTLLDLAREVVELSRAGLARRAHLDGAGRDETRFLSVIDKTLELGRTPAEVLLDRYLGDWDESVDPVFDEEIY